MKRRILLFAIVSIVGLCSLAACTGEVERSASATPVTTGPTTPPLTPTATATPATPVPTIRSTTRPATPTAAPELFLVVLGPENGSTVRVNAVVVHGTTRPGAKVEIQDAAIAVDQDGRFQSEVSLSGGANVIRVVATDIQGNQESRVLTVTSLDLPPQPFLLVVTEPEDQSIVSESSVRLSGHTGPNAITSVNGVSVSVDALGFFSTVVTLDPGPNIIDVVATNDDGRVLSAVIALIYRE